MLAAAGAVQVVLVPEVVDSEPPLALHVPPFWSDVKVCCAPEQTGVVAADIVGEFCRTFNKADNPAWCPRQFHLFTITLTVPEKVDVHVVDAGPKLILQSLPESSL